MNRPRRKFLQLAAGAVTTLACSATLAADPKRVLVLHSFGRDFKPWTDTARAIREELEQQTRWSLDLIDQSLVTARGENPEGPFVDYLNNLSAKTPLDLIIALGGPAAGFVQRHRHNLFPGISILFAGVQLSRVPDVCSDRR